ncbi:hypothetical protein GB937_000757 [Aspergillus fischeri]|nr:hypothetical protein GB937_000757 [Aspergillus fischeri]
MDPWKRQLMENKLTHSARYLTTSVILEARKSKHATDYQDQAPSSLHMDRALSSLSLDFKDVNVISVQTQAIEEILSQEDRAMALVDDHDSWQFTNS